MRPSLVSIQQFKEKLEQLESHWFKKTKMVEYGFFGFLFILSMAMVWMALTSWSSEIKVMSGGLIGLMAIFSSAGFCMRMFDKTSVLTEILLDYHKTKWKEKTGESWSQSKARITPLSGLEIRELLLKMHESPQIDAPEVRALWEEKELLGYWTWDHAKRFKEIEKQEQLNHVNEDIQALEKGLQGALTGRHDEKCAQKIDPMPSAIWLKSKI